MKKVNLLKYGLTALMMAFAMTLCYSCSNDDDDPTVEEPTPPTNGESKINGHAYVELAGYKWATENVGKVNDVVAIAGPGATYNEWGCYYYTQANAKLAAESWGGTWKLPTMEQWKALKDENNCTWTWQDSYLFNGNTMKGYKVSDKNDASKFIFLPAAGFCGGDSDVYGQGIGYYWSSDDEWNLYFNDGDRGMYINFTNYGLAVRPVSQ